ncbi:hypothetical protein PBRA_007898 [Plasmodiophora brassicae]|uniref:Cation-transporting P-type ATPase N-terminal domain-containing protein n=1 Tax=Plasmodiophora brassicae TaxID=37360 RepID=A0A0G4IYJ2_PLABS|nr:hypothetical protein PBRA_007898 [Plasmodiophora brassicae]
MEGDAGDDGRDRPPPQAQPQQQQTPRPDADPSSNPVAVSDLDALYWERRPLDEIVAQFGSSLADGVDESSAILKRFTAGSNDLLKRVRPDSRPRRAVRAVFHPLSLLMALAAFLSFGLGNISDGVVIALLCVLHAVLSYYTALRHAGLLGALDGQLPADSTVKRSGTWRTVAASRVIPGDILDLRPGDVVPADCLITTQGAVRVDLFPVTSQTAPVEKAPGKLLLAGATILSGTAEAIVVATGPDTVYGRHLKAISAEPPARAPTLSKMAAVLVACASVIVVVEIAVSRSRQQPWKSLVSNTLVVIVGAMPLAMPIVLGVTRAVAAIAMAKFSFVARRLQAIDRLSGMDVIAITSDGHDPVQRPLRLDDGACIASDAFSSDEVVFYTAVGMPTTRTGDDDRDREQDAILEACPQADDLWRELELTHRLPWSPETQRAVASVRVRANGNTFRVAIGTPHVVVSMDGYLGDDDRQRVLDDVYALQEQRGVVCVGVGVSRDPTDMPFGDVNWELVGVAVLREGDDDSSSSGSGSGSGNNDDTSAAKDVVDNLHVRAMVVSADGADAVADLVGRVGLPALPVQVASETFKVGDDPAGTNYASVKSEQYAMARMRAYATYSMASALRIALTFGLLTIAYNWYYPATAVIFIVVVNDATMVVIATDRQRVARRPQRWRLGRVIGQAAVAALWLAFATIILFSLARNTPLFPKVFGVQPLQAFDGTYRVGPDSDPYCNWELRFPRADLSPCEAGNFLRPVPPRVSYDDAIWEYYKQTYSLQGDIMWPCHEALAVEVCHIQQGRLARLRALIFIIVSVSSQLTIFVTRTRGSVFASRPPRAMLAAFFLAQTIATFIGVYGFGPVTMFSIRTMFMGISWRLAALAWMWAILIVLPLDLLKVIVRKIQGDNDDDFEDPDDDEDDGAERANDAKNVADAPRRSDAPRPSRRTTRQMVAGIEGPRPSRQQAPQHAPEATTST